MLGVPIETPVTIGIRTPAQSQDARISGEKGSDGPERRTPPLDDARNPLCRRWVRERCLGVVPE
jgi:hypothetical protein